MSGQTDTNQPILPPGRYELLVTENVARSAAGLGSRAQWRPLQRDEAPAHLARHLRKVLSSVLQSNAFEPHTQRQIEVCNRLIRELESLVAQDVEPSSETVARGEILLSVVRDARTGLGSIPPPDAPLTPLSDDAFFANSPNDPRLANELGREIASADRIDLLCAFITWNGLRVFKEVLRQARERGVELRVITTTYTGITEPKWCVPEVPGPVSGGSR